VAAQLRDVRGVCAARGRRLIAETRAWALGVKCEGAAGVEEHVQRSGGAVIVPYWQRSGSVAPAQWQR